MLRQQNKRHLPWQKNWRATNIVSTFYINRSELFAGWSVEFVNVFTATALFMGTDWPVSLAWPSRLRLAADAMPQPLLLMVPCALRKRRDEAGRSQMHSRPQRTCVKSPAHTMRFLSSVGRRDDEKTIVAWCVRTKDDRRPLIL